MFEFTDTQPQLNVQESEYLRLLGYPRQHAMSDRARELADWARCWYAEHGRPWIYAHGAGGLEIAPQQIRLSGTEFVSDQLHEQFSSAEAHDAMLVAVSAGKECEEKARQCWQEGKPDEYFFLELYGSAVVEHLVTHAAGRICAWADQNSMAALPHYSPGYTGWPVTDQLKLMSILRKNNGHSFPAELDVLDTGMLRPKKSLLAVFGLTRRLEKVRHLANLIPCENCSLPGCQYRRSPYRVFMPQPETISRQLYETVESVTPPVPAAPALDKLARYKVNARALKKWSQERLQLEIAGDGSVRARFRFEGTTCSNQGRFIEYDYHVRLQSRAQAYRIVEARCVPAEGDTGHQHQCEYLRDPDFFMRGVAAEKPLLNRPLNDVLAWERLVNPAGCHCEASSREHKWGMVYEVIHFTLAQKGAA